MTKKEALRRVKGYLTDYIPADNYEEVEETIEALEQKPCEDAISREDALQALCQAVHKNDGTIPCPNQRVSCLWSKTKVQDYAEEILKLPSVQPKQKTGHWVLLDECSNSGYYCSECHKKVVKEGWSNTVKKIKYCPNCGAKMVEPQEREDKE